MGRVRLIAVRILAAGAPLQAAEAPLLAASEKVILAGDERAGVLPPATGADTTPASVSPVSAGEREPLTPVVATRVSFPGIAPGARVRILPPAQFVFARHVPESSNRTWNPLH
jgi:hypothetical protein